MNAPPREGGITHHQRGRIRNCSSESVEFNDSETPEPLRCSPDDERHSSRAKNQPKEEVLGTDIPRTSGGHSRGYPGPKLRSGRSKPWKNKHLGADIHDPKARTSTTLRDFQKLRSEKLWAELSFPNSGPRSEEGVGRYDLPACYGVLFGFYQRSRNLCRRPTSFHK